MINQGNGRTLEEADPSLWLCLSGGNALGAFHAGAWEELQARALVPSRIAGASIGAIVATLLAGNTPDVRMQKLRAFWERAEQPLGLLQAFAPMDTRRLSALDTLLTGRPGLFHARPTSMLQVLSGSHAPPMLFDTAPLRETLMSLIDFAYLNEGPIRVILAAVDVETGEDAIFDSAREPLTVDHVMASAAFPLAFPPVEIAGRLYVDSGVSQNLPVRALFSDAPSTDVTCLCFDVAPPQGRRPTTMAMAAARAQDLVFASQSRHAIRDVAFRFRDTALALRLLHLVYEGADGKARSRCSTTPLAP
ncbi:patatin-like phospholipase family protein [Rhizobium sp. YIM 134829]|uniref:patatin-like phospholipase family protein n=1 Tax=Rhizobium sp. YIM 134829 TaxID=3390453 RepID=UPI003979904E